MIPVYQAGYGSRARTTSYVHMAAGPILSGTRGRSTDMTTPGVYYLGTHLDAAPPAAGFRASIPAMHIALGYIAGICGAFGCARFRSTPGGSHLGRSERLLPWMGCTSSRGRSLR